MPDTNTDGVLGTIVCRRPNRQQCAICYRPGTRLCDYEYQVQPGQKQRTCDLPLCETHAERTGPDRDLCPGHAKKAAAR